MYKVQWFYDAPVNNWQCYSDHLFLWSAKRTLSKLILQANAVNRWRIVSDDGHFKLTLTKG